MDYDWGRNGKYQGCYSFSNYFPWDAGWSMLGFRLVSSSGKLGNVVVSIPFTTHYPSATAPDSYKLLA